MHVDSFLMDKLASEDTAHCPESLIIPVLSSWVMGSATSKDKAGQSLYCLHIFPFVEGPLLNDPKIAPGLNKVIPLNGFRYNG